MKYGFIGCGNMGSAIVSAVSRVTKDIYITDRSGAAQKTASKLGLTYTSTERIAEECDRIFLAVKPQMMRDVLESVGAILRQRKPILITMAAGIKAETIAEMVGTSLPVIRIMPNTPVAVGHGVTVYCTNSLVQQSDLDDFISDMKYCGIVSHVAEYLMDAVSALSGSGPAYTYIFIEALADGAVACGIPRAQAIEYAANTVIGAAQMLLQSGKHPGELKDAVCSPAGSTIEGVQVLESHGFRGAVIDCVRAACDKNQKLGNHS